MNRLNGWQRIWVALTLLWGVFIGVMTLATPPTPPWHYREWKSLDVLNYMSEPRWNTKGCPDSWDSEDWQDLRATWAREGKASNGAVITAADGSQAQVHFVILTPNQVVTLCFAVDVSQSEQERIGRAYYETYHRVIRNDRFRHFGMAIPFWLVPAGAVYALGLAFVWVRRGFKHS